jgi:hypothetical protein
MITFDALSGIAAGTTLQTLKKTAFRDLQRALAFLTYSPGKIDGAYGPTTRSAWAEFKHELGEGKPEEVNASALSQLDARTKTFDGLLSAPAGDIPKVKASIIAACKAVGLGLKPQIAYVLATAEWETNHTFKPVREAYWVNNAEAWRKTHLKYYPYYGRGYVQLTWKDNYDHYGRILGLDLVDNPDLALDHYGSLFVLVQGFKTGAFTRHKLVEYVNANHVDFKAARFCINGQDQADKIAALAQGYLATL